MKKKIQDVKKNDIIYVIDGYFDVFVIDIEELDDNKYSIIFSKNNTISNHIFQKDDIVMIKNIWEDYDCSINCTDQKCLELIKNKGEQE